MRLPGFNHKKDPAYPKAVSIEFLNDNKYTKDNIKTAFQVDSKVKNDIPDSLPKTGKWENGTRKLIYV